MSTRRRSVIAAYVLVAAILSLILLGCRARSPETKYYELDVQLPVLEYFTTEQVETLRRFLQTSLEWEVVQEGNDLVSYRRVFEDGSWKRPSNGFVSNHSSGFIQTRYLFRFANEGGGPFRNRANRGFFTQVDPLAGKVLIKVSRPTYMPEGETLQSYIAVGRPGLWFEFFEERGGVERSSTVSALTWLKTFLTNVQLHEEEMNKEGVSEALLPHGSFRRGEPQLQVVSPKLTPEESVNLASHHKISAWLNPAKQGCLITRVTHSKTGQVLAKTHRCEFIGWSQNPEILFPFEDILRISAGAPYGRYDATFEIWLQPNAREKGDLVLSTTEEIQGWYGEKNESQ